MTTDYMVDDLGEALAKEIDKEIMETIEADSLTKKGWTVSNVAAPKWPFDRPSWATDTAEWCHKHCSGDYRLLNRHWYFQNAKDATMFALVWA